MSDITFSIDGYHVNLRVAAIVCQQDQILICRVPDKDWWFLPGGRIKASESSLIALKRELCEEIGDNFHIARPSVCSENFFELDGRCFHEVCTYYEVQWLGTKAR
jgi:8-oxo-dGTP pyrophosphatase MutT (NUDIX family)